MKQPTGSYPHVRVQDDGRAVVSRAGSVLLVETVRKTGLDQAVSQALPPWRKPRAFHDPGKVLLDVALAVALGGDCLADVAMLRCEPAIFGPVASDPTISRLIDTLAPSEEKALQAIRSARSEVRQHVWSLAGGSAPDTDGHVTVDLDGVLVIAHSDKQDAAATWKKTYGHHPLTTFVDHGPGGTGEPPATLLRPGNAGSNTAADHITTARLALTQLPKQYRRGRQSLIRTDSAGGTHDFVAWLAKRGRWLSYPVGTVITETIRSHGLDPGHRNGRRGPRRRLGRRTHRRPAHGLTEGHAAHHPQGTTASGAQLRITDADGMRITCFATNTTDRPIAAIELRHRLRARAEDRVRAPRDRNAQPAPAAHRPEQGLAGDRPDHARSAGLDARARPDRTGPALRAQPAAIPPLLRGRPVRHHRPAPHPPPCPPLALDRRDHRRL